MGECLRAENLTYYSEGRAIVRDVNLALEKGERIAILGANGAGKSTLLALLGMVLRPYSGTLWVCGQKVEYDKSLVQLRRRVALVFQENLLIDGSVWDNVALGLRLRGLRRSQVQERVQEWLERFEIAHLASRHAREISGGEARRVVLARAFCLHPEIMLLDEPFSFIDARNKPAVIAQVAQWAAQNGAGLVIVTHELEEARLLGCSLLRMDSGKVTYVEGDQRPA
ncbi:MAG: energy-coupling factor ABC transporter ATP-binding protein [Bacillota bacterium]